MKYIEVQQFYLKKEAFDRITENSYNDDPVLSKALNSIDDEDDIHTARTTIFVAHIISINESSNPNHVTILTTDGDVRDVSGTYDSILEQIKNA